MHSHPGLEASLLSCPPDGVVGESLPEDSVEGGKEDSCRAARENKLKWKQ